MCVVVVASRCGGQGVRYPDGNIDGRVTYVEEITLLPIPQDAGGGETSLTNLPCVPSLPCYHFYLNINPRPSCSITVMTAAFPPLFSPCSRLPKRKHASVGSGMSGVGTAAAAKGRWRRRQACGGVFVVRLVIMLNVRIDCVNRAGKK